MSVVRTFSHTQSMQVSFPPQHSSWADFQQQNDSNTAEVCQRVQPGQALNCNAGHVVVSLDDSSTSKADLHIGDLVYFTNKKMVTDLNSFLSNAEAPYGPYLYISDTASELQKLQKRKPNKAAQLRGYLETFASEQGLNASLFDQWFEVVWAKDRRDLAAHPLKQRTEDLSYLKGLIADPNSPLQCCAAAVEALVKVAERLGLK